MLLSVSPTKIDLDSTSFSSPSEFVKVGNVCYFSAEDTAHGIELWATDGTTSGTHLVKDIYSGATDSSPSELIEFNGKLYFVADDGSTGKELWMSDGTAAGTVLVKDIYSGTSHSSPTHLTVVGNTLYFAAQTADGVELWKSDGTAAGTALVKDIYTGSTTTGGTTTANSSSPTYLTNVNGTLYFVAKDADHGLELWKSDGTSGGTAMVKEINTSGDAFGSGDAALIALGNKLLFVATDGSTGYELWTSDGTSAGTTLLKEINSGSSNAFDATDVQWAVMDGVLYFAATDATHGNELWRSDGTASGTYLLKDIDSGTDGDLSDYVGFTVVGDTLFFAADDGEHGKELWKTDGTADGTVLVKDLDAGSGDSFPFYGVASGDLLYFSAHSEGFGRELWVSDGTADGTRLLADTVEGATGSYPSGLAVVGDYLVYSAYVGSGRELYSLNPNAAGDETATLKIWVDGQEVAIPANIGVYSSTSTADVYTSASTGEIIFDRLAGVTLGDFFEIWRTNAGGATNNADATFNMHELMGHDANLTHGVQMFVNGQVRTDFEDYIVRDGDQIILVHTDNPVVSLVTNYGSIVMELYEDDTPITVANFLTYVNDSDYVSSFFHRSVSDFVIQGGGFTTSSETFTDTSQFTAITSNGQITNESLRANLYGTVAMARTTDVNSATSQFFINLANNTNLNPTTSTAHDGYAVFGMVLDMTAVNAIGELSIDATHDSPFDELPYNTEEKLVVVLSVEGLGKITGTKFRDTDDDGVFDASEEGIEGLVVYVDANNNGARDDGEVWTTTDADGKYLLMAEPGTHTVRAEVSAGATATIASAQAVVDIGDETANIYLAETAIDPPTAVDLVAASDTGGSNTDNFTKLNNAAATLQFLVSGVTSGATVHLYCDGVEVGVATASGATVTVTTNGTTAIADGTHQFTATQTISGGESVASPALSVSIDSVAPAAIVSIAPAIATILTQYTFDADSPDEGGDGITYSLVNAPSGMNINSASGIVTWTPSATQDEPQEFDIVVSDAAGNTAVQSVDMTVLGVIAAYPDSYSVNEDAVLTVTAAQGVTINDDPSDAFGVLSAVVVDQPAHGTVTLNADGSFTYTPTANYFGEDSFTYRVTSGGSESNEAKVTLNVVAQNDPPVAVADSYTTAEDTVLTRTAANGVLANDTNPDSDTLTAILVTQPSHGTLVFNADGSFTYTPTANYNGADSFTYKITDGTIVTDPVTVSLTVTAVNDAPVTAADAYTTDEDTALTIAVAQGVLANDSDPDSTTLTATIGAQPSHGTVTLNANGSFVYTPTANYAGTDTFTYTVSDGTTTSSAVTVTLTVTAVADNPIATNDARTVANDGTTHALNVMTNDSDPDASDTISITAVTQGSNGGVVSITSGGVLYTPAAGYTGTETFTYTISDAAGHTATATVTMTVQAEGTGSTGTASIAGYVYLDADADGAKDSSEIGIPGVLITLTGTLDAGGTVTVKCLTDSNGYYIFDDLDAGTYKVAESQPKTFTDGAESKSDTAATLGADAISAIDLDAAEAATGYLFGEKAIVAKYVTVRMFLSTTPAMKDYLRSLVAWGEDCEGDSDLADDIRDGKTSYTDNDNASPVAVADTYTVAENATLTTTTTNGVLKNDTDADGDTLTASLVLKPTHGKLTLNTNGTFSYVPDVNYAGTDTFKYVAYDGTNVSNIVTVTITITESNDAPVGVADTYTVAEDGVLTVTTTNGVLTNDTDADGSSLTAEIVTQPAHGTLTFNANGTFVYTPTANYSGTDTFTYRATDGTLDSSATTVTITVTAANDAPTAVADAYTVAENAVLTVNAADGVLDNDSDADGNDLDVIVVAQPAHGTLTLNDDGSFVYTPATNYAGTDTFTYKANDGTADSNTVTVTITVTEGNDAPVGVADAYSTTEDTPLVVNAASGVLANDTDADSDDLEAVLVAGPAHGTITLNEDGSFTYTPTADYSGADSFTYRATDGSLNSATITVTLTVIAVNDAPTAVADLYSVLPSGQLTVNAADGVLKNDTDTDADTLAASVVDTVQHGVLTLNADGSFTYTPAVGFHGIDTFTYKVNDGTADSETVTVAIHVNTPADVAADAYQVDEDGVLNVTAVNAGVLANDSDDDGDSLTVSVVTGPAHGSLVLNAEGTFTYTPDANFFGTDSFTYQAVDGYTNAPTATVTITVNPANDAPVGTTDSYSATENVVLSINATNGVLANDTDIDSTSLTAVLVDQALHGVVTLNADGSFTYTPAVNYAGTDTFTYKASDSALLSELVTVTITVAEGNDMPVGEEDDYSVAVNTLLTVAAASGVLANDTDADTGDTLTVTVGTTTSNGTLTLAADGSFTYQPGDDFHGTDTFTYTVSDGTLTSAPITVRIDVNDPAAVQSFTPTTNEDQPLTVDAASGVLLGATDANSDSLTAVLITGPLHGTVQLNDDGSYVYTPSENYHGTDSFVFAAFDGYGNSNQGTVAITVEPVNDAPVAVADDYDVEQNTPLAVDAALGVLWNDSDVDLDSLIVSLVDGPLHGDLVWNTNGSFTYTPHEDYVGEDSFTYTAGDGTTTSAVTTVTLDVA